MLQTYGRLRYQNRKCANPVLWKVQPLKHVKCPSRCQFGGAVSVFYCYLFKLRVIRVKEEHQTPLNNRSCCPPLWTRSQVNGHLTCSYFIKFHLSGRKHFTQKNRLRASRTLFRCVGFHHLPPGDDHAASTTKSELLSRKLRLPHQRCAWPCFHPILRRRRDHASVKFTIYKMALRFLPLKQPKDWGGKSQESLEPLPTDRSGLSI